MPDFDDHILTSKKSKSRLFVFFLFLFAWTNCNQHKQKDRHPEYFNKVYQKVDTTDRDKKGEALLFLDSSFNAFPDPGILDLYEKDSIKADIFSYAIPDYGKAVMYADSMIMLVQNKTDREEFAELYVIALYHKGAYLSELKKFDEAFQCYSTAKEVELSKVKNKCNLSLCGGYISDLLYVQKKYLETVKSCLRDYQELSTCNKGTYQELMAMQKCYALSGLCYLKADIYDSALYYCDKALQLINENEKKFSANYYSTANAKGVIYGYEAQIFFQKKDFSRAEELYKMSIENTKADIAFTKATQMNLAKLYVETGKLTNANELLGQLKNYLDTFSYEDQLLKWYKLRAEYFNKEKQFQLADDAISQYEKVKDSFEVKDQNFANVNIANAFQDFEQKYLIDTLKKDNQLKTAYFIIALLAFAIAFIIIAFVWNNLRRTRNYVKELKKTNLRVIQSNVELQKAYKSLEQSHDENRRILKIVAHDLKNPISAIKNLTYSLIQKDEEGSRRKVLEVIQDSCTNSLSLINDLLNDKKGDSASVKEIVDIKKMLEHCVELLQAKANEKNQKLKLKADDVSAILDDEKIWRVVSNIINNAIKFSFRDGEIDIKLEKKGSTALLSVIDNGIGIPSEIADKIFAMSDEARRPGTAEEQSYGLGLSISKKIIEEHGGKIWFESTNNEGTVFYIELPCLN